MSGIWESARHGVPVWPGMPAGSPSPATYYAPSVIGGYRGAYLGGDILGVARAWPIILDKPRKVQSIGVQSASTVSATPGDTWEVGIYDNHGASLLWSGTITGAGLSTYSTYLATVELDLPQEFIVTIAITASNGGNYYGKNLGGANPIGWNLDGVTSALGGGPLQGPTGLPSDLSGFSSATLSGIGVWKNPIQPIVKVYS